MLTLLLDAERDVPPPPAGDWQPSAPPRRRRVLADTLTGPHGPSKPFRDLGRAISSPRRAARRGRETVRALMPIGRTLVTAKKSPLNGPIGPRRRWATVQLNLDDMKTIGKTLGGTVNDVVLAAVAGGIREFLKHRGEQLDGFDARSMVPVSMRVKDEQGKWANQVSAVFIELPARCFSTWPVICRRRSGSSANRSAGAWPTRSA
jgi:diacylglycerol O-acyltransferase